MNTIINIQNNLILLSGEKQSLTMLALLIILSIFIASIIIVGIIKIISVAVKLRKAKKKLATSKKDMVSYYTDLFGGTDNIVKTERSLNRIMVEVIDRSKVDLEKLKELNIGTQITGNVIKCSSSEMADSLENFTK